MAHSTAPPKAALLALAAVVAAALLAASVPAAGASRLPHALVAELHSDGACLRACACSWWGKGCEGQQQQGRGRTLECVVCVRAV